MAYGLLGATMLMLAPALCCIPFFTAVTGKPYAAVFMTVSLLVAIKLLGCVIVRIIYGPNALEAGYMTLPWATPNLLVWCCLVGTFLCSCILYPLGRRIFLHAPGADPIVTPCTS